MMKKHILSSIAIPAAIASLAVVIGFSSVYAQQYQSGSNSPSSSNMPGSSNMSSSGNMTNATMGGNMTSGNMTGGNMSSP
jgi:hypothetical protein